MRRLKERLSEFGFDTVVQTEQGYVIRIGPVRWIFLSADDTSSVVGHTADILLEIDESQDVSKDKYSKEFRPMASASNATTVDYGTTWMTALFGKRSSRLILNLKSGTASSGISAIHGRKWRSTIQRMANLWRVSASGLEKTIRFFEPSISWSF